MKTLFLASYAAYTLNKLLDYLPKPPNKLIVAFIPTAAGPYENKWFVDEDRDKLIELGFNVRDIDIETKTETQLADDLKDIDMIFVAGGNAFYLLEKAIASGFDKLTKSLVNQGIIYVGSSAGSVFVGPTLELVRTVDDPLKAPQLKTHKGLNIVDFVVLPHIGNEKFQPKYDEIIDEIDNSPFKVIKLKDNQAVLVHGDDVKIIS